MPHAAGGKVTTSGRARHGALAAARRAEAVAAPVGAEGWWRPSPKLLPMRRVQLAVWSGLLAIFVGVWIGAWLGGGVGSAIAFGILALGAEGQWLLGRRIRAWGYSHRGDDLLVRRGVMVNRLSVVPYARMQFVDVTAGPFERAFGLATVKMHTAAAAAGARIPGLERARADHLRDQLAALAEAHLADL